MRGPIGRGGAHTHAPQQVLPTLHLCLLGSRLVARTLRASALHYARIRIRGSIVASSMWLQPRMAHGSAMGQLHSVVDCSSK